MILAIRRHLGRVDLGALCALASILVVLGVVFGLGRAAGRDSCDPVETP